MSNNDLDIQIDEFSLKVINETNSDLMFLCNLVNYTKSIPVRAYLKTKKLDAQPYEIDVTPCYVAAQTGTAVYAKDVQKTFPLDVFFTDNDVDAYVGIAVYQEHQVRPLGLLVVLYKDAIDNAADILDILKNHEEEAAKFLEQTSVCYKVAK